MRASAARRSVLLPNPATSVSATSSRATQRGRYAESLARWFALFPASTSTWASEDYYTAPNETVRAITAFLGLDPERLPAIEQRLNAAPKTDMEPATRDRPPALLRRRCRRDLAAPGPAMPWPNFAGGDRSAIPQRALGQEPRRSRARPRSGAYAQEGHRRPVPGCANPRATACNHWRFRSSRAARVVVRAIREIADTGMAQRREVHLIW